MANKACKCDKAETKKSCTCPQMKKKTLGKAIQALQAAVQKADEIPALAKTSFVKLLKPVIQKADKTDQAIARLQKMMADWEGPKKGA